MTSKITATTKVNVIIGDPVTHSLTPALHNAAYEQLGLGATFVMTAATVSSDDLEAAIEGLRTLGIYGITVTTPHKEAIIPFLDQLDSDAKTIGAVNTVTRKDTSYIGSNTDWVGIVDSLSEKMTLKGAKILVLGAGGASRAAIFGLKHAGALVTVANRTREKAQTLSKEFSIDEVELHESLSLETFGAVVNCTSAGMVGNPTSPLPGMKLTPTHIVFETTYHPRRTPFVIEAERAGASIIYGTEMFFHQAVAQIEKHTGSKVDKVSLRVEFDRLLNTL